ncbi:MAG: TetR/AcrR family transcriptional regulator [Alphaproteobacteria bacterium]
MELDPEHTLSRRERKKRETRKRILDAAVSLISQKAYDDVRIEDICAAADVANATFFLHFPNKPALVRAFGEEITERLNAGMADPGLSASAQLEKLLTSYIDQWRSHRNLMQQIVLEFVTRRDPAPSFNEVAPGLLDLVARTIRKGQQSGDFLGRIEPEIAALSLVAAWNAIAISASRSPDLQQASSALWQTLELFLAGLKSCGQPPQA